MEELNKTIRIRTTPGGDDKHLNVKIEQSFDFLEVLSLKISQEDLYPNFCSNYGVVVGRVLANQGFGVPNAKVLRTCDFKKYYKMYFEKKYNMTNNV